MVRLQEWIHKLEEGEGTRFIKLTAVFLALLALTALYDIREYKNFSSQEAMDTAQLARNLAEGRGYTTHFIRPLSIFLLQRRSNVELEGLYSGLTSADRKLLLDWEKNPGRSTNSPTGRLAELLKQRQTIKAPTVLGTPHPDLANPPVYPLLLAGLMKILPFEFEIATPKVFRTYQPEILIAGFNQLLFFASLAVVFFLAQRLFDAAVAWFSTLVFAGSEVFWRFSVSGQSTLLLVLIWLGLVWCLVRLEAATREGEAAGSDVVSRDGSSCRGAVGRGGADALFVRLAAGADHRLFPDILRTPAGFGQHGCAVRLPGGCESVAGPQLPTQRSSLRHCQLCRDGRH